MSPELGVPLCLLVFSSNVYFRNRAVGGLVSPGFGAPFGLFVFFAPCNVKTEQ